MPDPWESCLAPKAHMQQQVLPLGQKTRPPAKSNKSRALTPQSDPKAKRSRPATSSRTQSQPAPRGKAIASSALRQLLQSQQPSTSSSSQAPQSPAAWLAAGGSPTPPPSRPYLRPRSSTPPQSSTASDTSNRPAPWVRRPDHPLAIGENTQQNVHFSQLSAQQQQTALGKGSSTRSRSSTTRPIGAPPDYEP